MFSMPFSKTWEKKVTLVAFPFRRNDAVVCHNCWRAWYKDDINCCTGLCGQCQKLKEIKVNMVANQSCIPNDEYFKCKKCGERLLYANIGIFRQKCKTCLSKNFNIAQRCLYCEETSETCWNNICSKCVNQLTYLCENTGGTYLHEAHHFKLCWCLSHEQQVLRSQEFTEPPVTFVEN